MKKKIVIREADVFAAYTAYVDHEIGRVIQAVEDMGKLDNTLIIYINGDNGTSSEGTMMGTPNWMAAANGVLELPEASIFGTTSRGVPTRPIRTWRCRGPGRSTRPSSG